MGMENMLEKMLFEQLCLAKGIVKNQEFSRNKASNRLYLKLDEITSQLVDEGFIDEGEEQKVRNVLQRNKLFRKTKNGWKFNENQLTPSIVEKHRNNYSSRMSYNDFL
jgi:hypothetical protein